MTSRPEVPGANGLGRTVEEARQNLVEAIALILKDQQGGVYSLSIPEI